MAELNLSSNDKERLKKAFDLSSFDLNAVLRGIQLTLVGGTSSHLRPISSGIDSDIQHTAPSKTPTSSPIPTIGRLPLLSLPGSPSI
jgi:hypothetical protein